MAERQTFADDIPRPECYATLLVYADYERAYLWDMNSVSIDLESITGKENEPLHLKFEQWSAKYDIQFPEPAFENMPKEREDFNREGLQLAEELFEYLGRRNTIIYCPLEDERVTFTAESL